MNTNRTGKRSLRTVGGDPRVANRRHFLRVGSLPLLGMTLPQMLRIESALAAGGRRSSGKAQACILLWLNGGPSHIDMWDPKPNSSFDPVSTNVPGIQVSELLPLSAQHMDQLSIIRSMKTPENNHGLAHHYAMTGHRPNPAMRFPALGPILTNELSVRRSIPPNVMLPPVPTPYVDYFGAHFLGAGCDPLMIPDPHDDEFEIPDLKLPESLSIQRLGDRREMLSIVDRLYRRKVIGAERVSMDTFQEQALEMILSQSVRDAFDLSRESEKVKDAYGRNTLGQSALLARRLVEAGSRFVTVMDLKRDATGRDWDTHGTNDSQHRDHLVPPLDRALATLLSELADRGLLDSTVVMVMGEFGRTHDINPSGGRDHWCHCWSLVLGGGGIPGGRVIGASDERGAYVADRQVSIGDLFATLYKAFGIDWTKEYLHPIGRPLKIANSNDDETGKPISELI